MTPDQLSPTSLPHTTDIGELFRRDRDRRLSYGDLSESEHHELEKRLSRTMDRRLRERVDEAIRSDAELREKVWALIEEAEFEQEVPSEVIKTGEQSTPVAIPDLETLEERAYRKLHQKVLQQDEELLELARNDEEWAEARNQLVTINLGIFNKVASDLIEHNRSSFNHHSNVRIEDLFEDLRAHGYEVALRKAYKYDHSHDSDTPFAYYIANWALQEMKKQCDRERFPIDVSPTKQRRMRQVHRQLTEEEKKKQVDVDPREVAQRCNGAITQAHVEKALEFQVDSISLDAPPPGKEEDKEPLEACLGGEEDGEAAVPLFGRAYHLRQLLHEVVEEEEIKPGDVRVLLAKEGLDSRNGVDKTFGQIGAREGYSAERARQRYNRVVKQLKPVLARDEELRQAFSDVVDFSQ